MRKRITSKLRHCSICGKYFSHQNFGMHVMSHTDFSIENQIHIITKTFSTLNRTSKTKIETVNSNILSSKNQKFQKYKSELIIILKKQKMKNKMINKVFQSKSMEEIKSYLTIALPLNFFRDLVILDKLSPNDKMVLSRVIPKPNVPKVYSDKTKNSIFPINTPMGNKR